MATRWRYVLACAAVLSLAALVAVDALASRPLSSFEPQTTIQTEHLTAKLYTKRTELARRYLEFLELQLDSTASAFGVTVERQPVIRFYDGNNYPYADLSTWIIYSDYAPEFRLNLDPWDGDPITEAELRYNAIYQYTQYVVYLRADHVYSSSLPSWFYAGVAGYYSQADYGTMQPSQLLTSSELDETEDSWLLHCQGTMMVSEIVQEYGFSKLLETLDAYAVEYPDGVRIACGISEDELIERVRAELGK